MSEENNVNVATDPVAAAEPTTKEVPAADKNTKPIFSNKDLTELNAVKTKLLNDVSKIVPKELLQKESPTEEDKEAMKQHIASYIEKQYLDRWELSRIDLDNELNLVLEKRSSLSRSRRDALLAYFYIFRWGPTVQKKLNELEMKENKTPEEEDLLKELLGTKDLKVAYDTVKKSEEPANTEDRAPSNEEKENG